MTVSADAADNNDDYVLQHLPPKLVQRLEAAAFQSLVQHLQERSDTVPNINLMTVSGFCRNCLAKVILYTALYFLV